MKKEFVVLNKLNLGSVILATLALGACGGSDNTILDPGGGGGTDPGDAVVEMGSGIPPAFSAGIIDVGIGADELSAGGSTSLSVTFASTQDGVQSLFAESVDVTFTSGCIANGGATITGPTSTATGILTVTYAATGCRLGDDQVTATANVNGRTLSARATISVAVAEAGSIVFLSADPTNIGLRGTGIDETSVVTFEVRSSSGGTVPGAQVEFSLQTQNGDVVLQPATATSGANGQVQTTVRSGTNAGTVRVKARVVDTGISTQSSQLVISTGLPDQNSMSMAVSCYNVEALTRDGTQVDVTVRMSDRFNNPVPDGTAVTFNTEGGSIGPSCTTTTTNNESGICTVKWTSSEPRPADGRSTILAMALGEETTVDVNRNGFFDGADTWTDIPEAFRDDDEDGVYDGSPPNEEYFFDFNQDGLWTAADGQYSGVLCEGPGSPAGGCAPNQTLTVSASNKIIMSGSTAVITDNVGGALVASEGNTYPITFLIGDVNDQPMPAGTTITATTSNGKVVGTSSYEVDCTTQQGPLPYTFRIEGDSNDPATGILTVEVEVPSGLKTYYTITISDS